MYSLQNYILNIEVEIGGDADSGCESESSYDITYINMLREILDVNGLQHVKLVAADGAFGIEHDMVKDEALNNIYPRGALHRNTQHSSSYLHG